MEDILILRLYSYGLTMVKKDERCYFLVDLYTGEWYEDMSIYYINSLLSDWSKNKFKNCRIGV